MVGTTVRISESARDTLRDLAGKTGESMQTILERAIEEYRRRRFLEETNAAYAALREDGTEWAAMRREQSEWDATLLDGLDPDERWPRDDVTDAPT